MTDMAIVSRIIIFLSSISFIVLLFPVSWQFITVQSLSWFTGGTIAVTAACVVATGIPCAVAIAIYAAITAVLSYFSVFTNSIYSWISALILTPISIILIIFITRLARGN